MSIPLISVFIPSLGDGILLRFPLENCPDVESLLILIFARSARHVGKQDIKLDQLSLRSLHHPISFLGQRETIHEKIKQIETNNEFDVPHSVSSSWCDQDKFHVYVYIDPNEMIQAAENLKKVLWGKRLETILSVTSDGSRYVPKEWIKAIGLDKLGYEEDEGLLIRAEYGAALAMQTFDRQNAMEKHIRGVYVTGLPGIGKSTFLYYLLFHFLSQEIPVAFEVGTRFLVFQANGVSSHSVLEADGDCIPKGSWALSDSSSQNKLPCYAFVDAATKKNTLVIQATPPLAERWKSWSKEHNAIAFVMEPFSIIEIAALGEVLGLDIDDLRRRHKKWGPSARICVGLSRSPATEAEHENDVIADAEKFIYEQNFLRVKDELESAPHKLFSVQPLGKGDVAGRMCARANIATSHIRRLVSYAAAAAQAHHRITFFQHISRFPMLRSAAGVLFERFVLCWLGSGSKSPLPCTTVQGVDGLEIPACKKVVTFDHEDTLKKIKVDYLPLCLAPSSSFLTLDAIIITARHLITVQVTLSDKHSAEKSGFDAIEDSHIRNRNLEASQEFDTSIKGSDWCHVFVTDDIRNTESLQRQNLPDIPKYVSVHCTVFDVGRSDVTAEKMQEFEELERAHEDSMDVDNG